MARPPALRARLALTALWLGVMPLFLRYWEFTLRCEGWMIWSLISLALYAAAARVYGVKFNLKQTRALCALLVILCLAGIAQALIPSLTIRGARVSTAVLVKVADFIVPLWIAARGVLTLWSGRRAWFVLALLPIWLLILAWGFTLQMPGASHRGPLGELRLVDEELAARLDEHIRILTEEIGSRGHFDHVGRRAARDYIEASLVEMGYAPIVKAFPAGGDQHWNLEATAKSSYSIDEIVLVGAHYDVCGSTPGADDNATGVAALLEIARMARTSIFKRSLRFVFFSAEEPPFFGSENMGSRVYARESAVAQEQITAMFALESIGFYNDAPGSQRYPFPLGLFFPDRGDFIAFVGNLDSRPLARRSIRAFRESTAFPSQGCVAPSFMPGVFWSDHASFWKEGYQAIMITDTALFRNPHYHEQTDTRETLDLQRLARVVLGIVAVIDDAADALERGVSGADSL